jgi:hypothetical protein
MPRSSSGKWVARAGATGGGRTYRGQVPANWYAVLVLIVILGIGSVVFARYEYQNPKSTADTVAPTKGTEWFSAMVFDVCGTQSTLASNEVDPTKQSFITTGDGVIVIDPKKTADAGDNAVLAKLLASYTGLSLTSTEIKLPPTALASSTPTSSTTTTTTAPASSSTTTSTTAASSTTTSTTAASSGSKLRSKKTKTKSKKTSKATTAKKTTAKVYKNGGTCPAGTKDAGKKGVVKAVYWRSAFASKAKPVTVKGEPSSIKFLDDQLITIGFVPAGTALPKPNGTVVTALLNASTGASSTTTTTAASGTTTTTTSSSK